MAARIILVIEHSVYGILVLVTALFLVLIPTIVISLHSFKFSRQFLEDRMFTRRTVILIHYFVEKFQGYYKNGSAGTRDYRMFSSFHIALITTMHLLYGKYLFGGWGNSTHCCLCFSLDTALHK